MRQVGQPTQTERTTGIGIGRTYVDRGYRGHDADKARVILSGQKRSTTPTVRQERQRHNAIEPIIGHMTDDGHLGRKFLLGPEGDATDFILTATCHPPPARQRPPATSAASRSWRSAGRPADLPSGKTHHAGHHGIDRRAGGARPGIRWSWSDPGLHPHALRAEPFRGRWVDSIYISHSTDGGPSRTEPAPAGLPNNNSSIQAVRLANGHLAMVYNHSSAVDATGWRLSPGTMTARSCSTNRPRLRSSGARESGGRIDRPFGRALDAASDERRRVVTVRVCRRAVIGIAAALVAGHPARAQGWPTRLVVPDGAARAASSR
jgi:BNR repeat-like domain